MDDRFSGVTEWKCSKGHVLGLVKRVKAQTQGGTAYHVSRLLLFRQAVDREAVQPDQVDVIAAIEGTTLDIRCSVCGLVRSWHMGADALARLLDKFGGEHANEKR